MPSSLHVIVPDVSPTSRMRFRVPDVWEKSTLTRSQRREMARQQQAVRDAYHQHQEVLRALLPPALRTLLDLPLDDARMTLIAIDRAARTLRLHLSHSDPAHGAFRLRLCFHGVTVSQRTVQVLRLVARQGNRADVKDYQLDLPDETESLDYVCRFQWHTQLVTRRDKSAGLIYTRTPEIEMRFAALEVKLSPSFRPCPSPRCLFHLR